MKRTVFVDKKINKSNFYKNSKVFNKYEIDVTKIFISKKGPYGKKSSFEYFVGHDDDNVIRRLCTKLHQMIGYAQCFDSNKTMSFKVNDNNLLKKYTKKWKGISSLMDIKSDSEPVYIAYRDKINTNFQGKKYQKKMHHTNVYH